MRWHINGFEKHLSIFKGSSIWYLSSVWTWTSRVLNTPFVVLQWASSLPLIRRILVRARNTRGHRWGFHPWRSMPRSRDPRHPPLHNPSCHCTSVSTSPPAPRLIPPLRGAPCHAGASPPSSSRPSSRSPLPQLSLERCPTKLEAWWRQ
jgi:hypothetical protein